MFAPRAFVFAPAALMMIVCAALFAPAMAVAEQGTPMPEIDNSDWAAFLTSYRREGSDGVARVAYAEVSDTDHAALKAYIDQLEQIDPGALGEDEAFAYWVNLYNAVTIDVVLDNYPVRSIRNINSGIRPGPWRRKLATVKGEDLSLDDIEHEILRKEWSDNRVHYAVNCASIGCPDLAAEPFTGARLDEMLDAAASEGGPPLVVSILAASLAAASSAWIAYYNAEVNRAQHRRAAENARILQMLNADTEQAASNL
ncbi:MAG: DUF547 domain-containing protein, partial [Pseudomonadota bacterium]